MQISIRTYLITTAKFSDMSPARFRERATQNATQKPRTDITQDDRWVRYYVIRWKIFASCTRCKVIRVLLSHLRTRTHVLLRVKVPGPDTTSYLVSRSRPRLVHWNCGIRASTRRTRMRIRDDISIESIRSCYYNLLLIYYNSKSTLNTPVHTTGYQY